jgi:exodeoxyribonuclease VII large subunit
VTPEAEVPSEDPVVLTVGRLGELLKEGLSALFPGDLWVEGQVSGFHDARSGHAYFDLVEPSDEPGRAVAAKLSVALFKQARGRVDRTLSEAGGLALSNDMQVRIRARIDFYPPSGRLQLIMQGIDPGFTLGRLAVERERLLHALADEGLLRANRANPIPVPPLRVGLVTSVGSAAHADFNEELSCSGFPFTILERDARVQGEGSAIDLAEALHMVATHRPDVIALVRGGGSATDLAAFDAEVLARTIATLDVAVVTGIGHEVDRAVADEVAHSAFKTPTACAAAIVGQVTAFADAFADLQESIAQRAGASTARAADLLDDLAHRTATSATAVLDRLGFTVQKKGDLVDAEVKNVPRSLMEDQLDMLGRLLGATRLMDMYMKGDERIDVFVEEFMGGRYHFGKTKGDVLK